MSVHPAVARRLFYRQRRWVMPGAILLASLAGLVDVAVIALSGIPVSHVSGSVARLAGDSAAGNTLDLWRVAATVIAFFCGAMVSGVVIGTARVLPGRRYGVALLLESASLAAAGWLLAHGQPVLGVPLAAVACGIQNGMANGFYGVVLRTTHLTGIVTDLGVTIGQWLRGGHVAWWRIWLLGGVLVGFLAGGVAGGIAVSRLGAETLIIPAVATLLGGIAYSWWLWRQHPARRTAEPALAPGGASPARRRRRSEARAHRLTPRP